jgi:uncharacterized HAD superfamily protein
MQTIAVDIDDVLAIENEAVRKFANERYGHQHSIDDYLVSGAYWGYWESVQGVDEAEGAKRYKEYLASGVKASLEAMPGALVVLAHLKQRYKLIIVTSREAHLEEITRQWLNQRFPEIFHDVAFVAIWTGTVKGSKADICRELGADYLIDDNPGHLALAAEAGITGLLFGLYGWSRDVAADAPYVRVPDWNAVKEYFDGK